MVGIPESWILDYRSRFSFVSGTCIPDFNRYSLSCLPVSKAQDSFEGHAFISILYCQSVTLENKVDYYYSRFYKQKSPGFQIPQAKISRIRESGFPYMG